jgi:hypothetical protein
VASATRNRNGIANRDGFNIGSGDGFYARIDPTDPRTAIIESQDGRANRVNLATLERQAITPLGTRPTTDLPFGPQEGVPSAGRERWNWNTPIAMSSFDPRVIYMGSNVLFRSTDRGATWKAVSGDLTANVDRESLEMMGARVPERALSRHDDQASFSTLTTVSESPLDQKVLYTGSDDGRINVTRDGGQKWTNVSARIDGLAAGTYVSSVMASRHVAGRVYATFDGHYRDDYGAYVYVSDDYGQTWRAIAGGLPATSVHRLREHPRNARLLFLGHERGIHFSIDAGAHWASLNLNMPAVPVDDILIHPRDNDLIVGTHGRSIWILDNIAALEAMTPESVQTDAFLVPPSRARLLSIYNPQAWYGAGQFFAPNPEFGAVVEYYLRRPTTGEVQLTVSDGHGNALRTIKTRGHAGLNRIVWDLRLEPPTGEGLRETPAANEFGGAPLAPLVLPGVYAVAIDAPGVARPLKGELRVEGDPRINFTDADRRVRQTALMKLYELERSLTSARASTSTARVGNDVRLAQLQAQIAAELTTASRLSRAIEGFSGLPTADQKRQVDWVVDDANRTMQALNRVLTQ